MALLTQNRELKEIGAWNWTLPALGAKLDDGRTILTCPTAGICAQFCYARNGTYLFRNVKAAHARNLKLTLDNLPGFEEQIVAELQHKKFRGGFVRIHDSGDFYSDEYTLAWLRIAERVPDVTFYAYTKEVSRFRRLVEGKAPANFRYLFSLGGKEDHLVDRENDRHAEVFPSKEALEAAGYFDQEASDLLAIQAPTNRIGIVANNIPAFKKKMGSRTFGSAQQEKEAQA
jgi:hypothetical protein